MKVRRIVTGHASDGRSAFLEDGTPPWSKDFEHTPGFSSSVIWQTPPVPKRRHDGNDPTLIRQGFVPVPGGTTFVIVTMPPDSVMTDPTFDIAAAGAEHAAYAPGFVDYFEADNPGMHTTPTIDYGIVLEGEISLELDDGRTKVLKPHDVVVQNGTRHAWRNTSGRAATLAFILIGSGGR